MFLKTPKGALQSILRTAVEAENIQPLPTDLSIFRDDASGRLLVDPAEVIAQVQKLKTQAMSPEHRSHGTYAFLPTTSTQHR